MELCGGYFARRNLELLFLVGPPINGPALDALVGALKRNRQLTTLRIGVEDTSGSTSPPMPQAKFTKFLDVTENNHSLTGFLHYPSTHEQRRCFNFYCQLNEDFDIRKLLSLSGTRQGWWKAIFKAVKWDLRYYIFAKNSRNLADLPAQVGGMSRVDEVTDKHE